jgi:hypothetical protein
MRIWYPFEYSILKTISTHTESTNIKQRPTHETIPLNAHTYPGEQEGPA